MVNIPMLNDGQIVVSKQIDSLNEFVGDCNNRVISSRTTNKIWNPVRLNHHSVKYTNPSLAHLFLSKICKRANINQKDLYKPGILDKYVKEKKEINFDFIIDYFTLSNSDDDRHIFAIYYPNNLDLLQNINPINITEDGKSIRLNPLEAALCTSFSKPIGTEMEDSLWDETKTFRKLIYFEPGAFSKNEIEKLKLCANASEISDYMKNNLLSDKGRDKIYDLVKEHNVIQGSRYSNILK